MAGGQSGPDPATADGEAGPAGRSACAADATGAAKHSRSATAADRRLKRFIPQSSLDPKWQRYVTHVVTHLTATRSNAGTA
ncbi:hypothetical protein GCM10027075_48890 [Streptomyces heilongjiangensis]